MFSCKTGSLTTFPFSSAGRYFCSSSQFLKHAAQNLGVILKGVGSGGIFGYSRIVQVQSRWLSTTKMASAEKKSSKFSIGLVQMMVGPDKQENLKTAEKGILEAIEKGAKIVVLPECFNSPYGISHFPKYAEQVILGPTGQFLENLALQKAIYIIAGSIPTYIEDDTELLNTTVVYGPTGATTVYSKSHLFDIDVPGRISFKESAVLTPGENLATAETKFCKIGLGICYDLRFPEIAQIYAKQGCQLLVYPGAFNMITGPAHWKILQQARALDNQVYVATCSPARDESAEYVAYGHSMIVNPWGEVVAEADEKATVLVTEIDLDFVQRVRDQIPVLRQKRTDIYETVWKKPGPAKRW